MARSFTSCWNSAVLATKSVSQLTSISTPILPGGPRAVVGAPDLAPGAALALLVEVAALDHRLGDRGAEESDGADGVVVARDLVVDQVRVTVRVDHRHHRDAELVGLLDGDLLLLGIDHEERVGELAQPLDAAQRGEALLAL